MPIVIILIIRALRRFLGLQKTDHIRHDYYFYPTVYRLVRTFFSKVVRRDQFDKLVYVDQLFITKKDLPFFALFSTTLRGDSTNTDHFTALHVVGTATVSVTYIQFAPVSSPVRNYYKIYYFDSSPHPPQTKSYTVW